MKKKVLALFLAAMMALAATACSNNNSGSSSGDSNSSGTTGESTGGEVDTSEHVVINYMTLGDIPTNQTDAALVELNKVLTEKANAEIALRWIEWTDYLTQYNLALASQSGDLDLVVTATDWLDAWPNAQKGAFLELTEDLLKTNAPKTWEQVEAAGHWDDCKLDG